MAFALLTLTGCAAVSPAYETRMNSYESYSTTTAKSVSAHTDDARPRTDRELRRDFVSETNRWLGTPYAYGGESRNGLDCSAFVQILYRNVVGLDLPRETTSQRRAGAKVRRANLLAGDLVFFDTGPRQSHVGVYLGGGEFSHSSSSSGVSISRLDDPYWNKRFDEGIRPEGVHVAAAPAATAPIRVVARESDSEADLRRGW